MCKCIGCGVESKRKLCTRCFNIRNYNSFSKVTIKKEDVFKILSTIKEDDLVVLVMDLLNIQDLSNFLNLSSNMILALTKYDLLPIRNDDKILNYFSNLPIKKMIISNQNNYHLDEFYELLKKESKTGNIYFVGYTNSGKSSLINKLIYNYSDLNTSLTTSYMPNTTISSVCIKMAPFNLIDTPGLIDDFSIMNYLDEDLIRKITKSKKIKPISYQIKKRQVINIENIVEIELENNNIILYFPNNLNIKRIYKKDDIKGEVCIRETSDLVISGLGFIKIMNQGIVRIRVVGSTGYYLRKPLI